MCFMKIPRTEAYRILRTQHNPLLTAEDSSLGHLSAGKLVDQIQAYRENKAQTDELSQRCAAVGLKFFFDAGNKIQFKQEH